MIPVKRLQTTISSDATRVLLRNRGIGSRVEMMAQLLFDMPESEAETEWTKTRNLFEHRHRDFQVRINDFYAKSGIASKHALSKTKLNILKASLMMEYSIEAAALFNPSIVRLPTAASESEALSFIMTLRSVGEGHISSIEFRQGLYSVNNGVSLQNESSLRQTGQVTDRSTNDRTVYQVKFNAQIPIEERVLFPHTPDESNGMEDLRMVEIDAPDTPRFIGTFTAYDGHHIKSKILTTENFSSFEISDLTGSAISGKGIAIFPRQIEHQYMALGRQDGINLTLMKSDSLTHWDQSQHLFGPSYAFDLTQIGNCGSPIETAEGWLVLTHGVGPVRRYTLGLALLDLEDPSRLIKYLPEPFMEPDVHEREGYVPNVLYTCGWIKHGAHILVPYAMSDTTCGFAEASIADILQRFKTI